MCLTLCWNDAPMEIMCTLTCRQALDAALVRELCKAGMQAVRINTAHLADTSQLEQMALAIKGVEPTLRILIDTKGPEMRTSAVASPIPLSTGDKIAIEGCGKDLPSTRELVRVNFTDIHLWATPGHTLLIDDATIELIVEAVDGRRITAEVTRGGTLGSHKGCAIAGVDVPLPAVSERDHAFVAYAAKSPIIDLVAHSFVRSADDVLAVLTAMGDHRKPVIAKIENQQGLDNLAEIAAEADGLLIARGDLGASIGKTRLPAAQQKIVDATVRAGKPAILATGILPSLAASPTPSAADIAGIRLAAAQGISTMLLTNETASSTHPVGAVATLRSTWPKYI